MQNIGLSLFFLFSSFSNSYANKEHPALASQAAFQEHIASKWQFQCNSDQLLNIDPDLNEHIQIFATEVIFNGLKQLSAINADFIYASLESSGGKNLIFSCPENHPGVAALKRGWFRSDRLYLGSVAFEVAAINNEVHQQRLRELFGQVWIESARQFNVQALFHEYLHHLRFDNFKPDIHNSKLNYEYRTFESDFVYACTAQVYPHKDVPIYEINGRKFMNTNFACMHCSSARKINGQNVLSFLPEDALRASKSCKNIRDEVFIISQ